MVAGVKPVDLNNPIPGHYLVKLVRNGPDVPVRIRRTCHCTIHGGSANAPHDWRDDCDRYPPIAAEIAGEPVPVERVWPGAAKKPIDAKEFHYRMAVRAWAIQHAPDSPEANPRQPVDLNRMPTLF